MFPGNYIVECHTGLSHMLINCFGLLTNFNKTSESYFLICCSHYTHTVQRLFGENSKWMITVAELQLFWEIDSIKIVNL